MLRILSKALSRHLEKYSELGYYSRSPERCVKENMAQKHSKAGDKKDEHDKLLQSLTPQLDKHLLLPDTYIPELMENMKKEVDKNMKVEECKKHVQKEEICQKEEKICKKEEKICNEEDKICNEECKKECETACIKEVCEEECKKECKKEKPRHKPSLPEPCPAQMQRVQEYLKNKSKIVKVGKCPAQVNRVKQSLEKRNQLKKRSKLQELSQKSKKACRQFKKVENDEVKSLKKDIKREIIDILKSENQKKNFEVINVKYKDYKENNTVYNLEPCFKINGKVCDVDKISNVCMCETRKDIKPPFFQSYKLETVFKDDKKIQDCLKETKRCKSCESISEKVASSVEVLEKMVKKQTDKLSDRLYLLGLKLEKDIKGMLASLEKAAKRGKKARKTVSGKNDKCLKTSKSHPRTTPKECHEKSIQQASNEVKSNFKHKIPGTPIEKFLKSQKDKIAKNPQKSKPIIEDEWNHKILPKMPKTQETDNVYPDSFESWEKMGNSYKLDWLKKRETKPKSKTKEVSKCPPIVKPPVAKSKENIRSKPLVFPKLELKKKATTCKMTEIKAQEIDKLPDVECPEDKYAVLKKYIGKKNNSGGEINSGNSGNKILQVKKPEMFHSMDAKDCKKSEVIHEEPEVANYEVLKKYIKSKTLKNDCGDKIEVENVKNKILEALQNDARIEVSKIKNEQVVKNVKNEISMERDYSVLKKYIKSNIEKEPEVKKPEIIPQLVIISNPDKSKKEKNSNSIDKLLDLWEKPGKKTSNDIDFWSKLDETVKRITEEKKNTKPYIDPDVYKNKNIEQIEPFRAENLWEKPLQKQMDRNFWEKKQELKKKPDVPIEKRPEFINEKIEFKKKLDTPIEKRPEFINDTIEQRPEFINNTIEQRPEFINETKVHKPLNIENIINPKENTFSIKSSGDGSKYDKKPQIKYQTKIIEKIPKSTDIPLNIQNPNIPSCENTQNESNIESSGDGKYEKNPQIVNYQMAKSGDGSKYLKNDQNIKYLDAQDSDKETPKKQPQNVKKSIYLDAHDSEHDIQPKITNDFKHVNDLKHVKHDIQVKKTKHVNSEKKKKYLDAHDSDYDEHVNINKVDKHVDNFIKHDTKHVDNRAELVNQGTKHVHNRGELVNHGTKHVDNGVGLVDHGMKHVDNRAELVNHGMKHVDNRGELVDHVSKQIDSEKPVKQLIEKRHEVIVEKSVENSEYPNDQRGGQMVEKRVEIVVEKTLFKDEDEKGKSKKLAKRPSVLAEKVAKKKIDRNPSNFKNCKNCPQDLETARLLELLERVQRATRTARRNAMRNQNKYFSTFQNQNSPKNKTEIQELYRVISEKEASLAHHLQCKITEVLKDEKNEKLS